MIENVLLDIDGVSNNFHYHIFNHFGLPYADESDYPVECGWDMAAAANVLAGYERFTKASFWKSITRELFATASVSAEFEFLLDWAERKVGREHVFFLTSPTLDPDCVAGKVEWIVNRAPRWMHRNWMIGPPKHLCAKSNALLIDDGDKNVEPFIAQGGSALLVPRPWNSLRGINTLDYMIEYLSKI